MAPIILSFTITTMLYYRPNIRYSLSVELCYIMAARRIAGNELQSIYGKGGSIISVMSECRPILFVLLADLTLHPSWRACPRIPYTVRRRTPARFLGWGFGALLGIGILSPDLHAGQLLSAVF